MRKLSAFLLPVAAVGALVASSLAVAGPAAADSWGYGYGRYERHEHFDRARHFDRYDRYDRSDRYRYERRGDWGRRDGGDRYGDHRGR